MGSSYFLKFVLLCFIITFLFLLSQYLKHDIVHYIVLRTSSITTSTKSMKIEFTINDTIHERLTKIQKRCGDLCNTDKPVQRGDFMGTVKAPVDCKNHFKLMDDISTAFSPIIPPKLDDLPGEVRSLYTYNNRLPTSTWYIDERSIGNERNDAKVFTLDMMEESFWGPIRNGSDVGWYPGCGKLLDEAADVINIEGKNVLVIGTQWPWAEAILLTKKPKKIVTLEYGQFVSEHPDWVFMRPNEFRQKYFDGTLETFDAVFSYSSLEHSGLGRYGDPLNPWGDIMAVAEAWCVTSSQAKFALAVPTYVSQGKDLISFNAARIYGPILYPYLTTNWKFVWPLEDSKRTSPDTAWNAAHQPIFIFEKNL